MRTERDSAYILLTTRLLGARSAAYLINVHLSTLKYPTSLDSHHIHTCMYVRHGHVPSTEFCRRSQAVICVNDIENINWREGGAPIVERDGDKIDARNFSVSFFSGNKKEKDRWLPTYLQYVSRITFIFLFPP